MIRASYFRFLAFGFLTTVLFTGCGDVGDAPEAETSQAVDVAQSTGTTLAIDTSQSEITFRAAKVTKAHDGGFHVFTGNVTYDQGQVAGVDVTIDTRSIYTDTERLTGHLKSEDFFQVEQYPEARFVSSEIVPADSAGATHLVTGNLTMHGQTRGITFPATINASADRVEAQADFIIDRTQWGILYTGKADDLIENNVRIKFDIVAGGVPTRNAGT